MDPNATLNQIITHIKDGELDEAEALVDALIEWLGRGGFSPAPLHKDVVMQGVKEMARVLPDDFNEKLSRVLPND